MVIQPSFQNTFPEAEPKRNLAESRALPSKKGKMSWMCLFSAAYSSASEMGMMGK
jgi:hypothetical protein